LVAFTDADISSAGEWYCTKNDTVVTVARSLQTIEEELLNWKRYSLSRLFG
jgi:hypothetical protein